jgi:D-arabinose 1-dehydrogenase-like Zn-dependent alcohol dehydrogenase
MKGLQVLEYGKPYHFSESLPIPTLESGDDVLIKIAVAGYCHTEVMVQRGEFAQALKSMGRDLPLVPSHEGVGRIAAVGANVKNLKVNVAFFVVL